MMTSSAKLFQLCLKTGDILNCGIFNDAACKLLDPVIAEAITNKTLITTRIPRGFSYFFSSGSDVAHIFYISKLLLRIATPIAER
jgi:hypothetical protein